MKAGLVASGNLPRRRLRLVCDARGHSLEGMVGASFASPPPHSDRCGRASALPQHGETPVPSPRRGGRRPRDDGAGAPAFTSSRPRARPPHPFVPPPLCCPPLPRSSRDCGNRNVINIWREEKQKAARRCWKPNALSGGDLRDTTAVARGGLASAPLLASSSSAPPVGAPVGAPGPSPRGRPF